jgi:GPH family glycoside/pentoside/hexuronide:cation symporter
VVYSLPSAAVHFTFMLTGVYLLKYATDVLLVGPAVMGLLFGLSRVFDAVADPVAGWLSDRTRSRLGRRRSWLLASVPPLAAGFWMMWTPPAGLSGGALAAWMGAGLLVYYVGTTVFFVPHEALAAELSTDYHERTRIFGVRTAVGIAGSLLGLGGMALLVSAAEPRRVAGWLAAGAGAALLAFTLAAVARLRERPDYQGRGGRALHGALRDVLGNPHAALLLFVFFVENFGVAILSLLIPFVMEYVLDLKDLTAVFIALYFVPALLFIPVWIRLSRRFGKKRLWLFSMCMLTVAFCGLFFVGEGDAWLVSALGLVAGVGGGCGQVVGPSLQADVIDVDEYRTGERKEGAYFAVWNFVRKGAFGVATLLSGLLLSLVGFEPNAEQSEATRTGLRVLFSFVPGLCYLAGTLAFLRFRLDEAEHAQIRRALDARALERAGAATAP